jgi:Protein of unknown function (DUF4232)
MRASVRVAWRVAAAVAFAATAALAITLTRGPALDASLVSAHNGSSSTRDTIGGSGHAPGVPPQCAPSRLDVSIISTGALSSRVVASHGHVYQVGIPVEFTNTSAAACTLTGYPAVSAYVTGGAQVGNAAALDTSVTARRIVLAPGASAHAAVVDSASAGQCRVVAATGLRIVPPGQSVARYVAHAVTACSDSGQTALVFLHVRAIEAGTGLPAGIKTYHSEPSRVTRPAPHHVARHHATRHQPATP